MLVLLLASLASASEFSFQYHPYRRSNEPCKVCYGDDCLQIDEARCEYYAKVDGILHDEKVEEEDSPVVRAEVDILMYRFMEKATATPTECVPFVSKYTDCTKENICTGCKSCSCNSAGLWNCSSIHKCRADVPAEVDHRMLAFIMENLNAQTNSRTKRSTQERLNKLNTNKLSFDEIAQWMYDDAQLTNIETTQNNAKSNDAETTVTETTPEAAITSTEATTVDYLGFDEVLNNIAVDSKTYSRRKPLDLVHNDSVAFDYMIFDEDNNTEAVTDKVEYDNMDKYSPTNEGDTDVVIDLLESAKKNQGEMFTANWTDYTEPGNKINDIDPTLDYIDNFILGSKNVMKRDIPITEQQNEVNIENDNGTSNVKDLRNNVLLPLSNIINDKQKELEELLRVSENLITIMRTFKNESREANIDANNDEDTNSSISIYNFNMTPELETEFRRSDSNLLNKYVKKLKRDVYEVIRDIASIQKLRGTTNIPQDLKMLLRGMKHYVLSQSDDKNNTLEWAMTKNRRTFESTDNDLTKVSLVTEFINILKFVDQNIPYNNALGPLSRASRKIIQRVIKNNYINEFSVVGLRVFNPQYNLTNDLKKIGSEWPRITFTMAQSKIHDKLQAMKLLHLGLSVDIIKMNDALALLDFAYNRRMILVEGNLGGEIMDKINKGLKAINDKIKMIIKLHNSRLNSKQKSLNDEKKVKKQSFLKKLKNILKSSKTDILSMLKKKVPKQEIIKGIAKKKMDEITRRRFMEFEDTMRKWQNRLNLVPRDKRSAHDDNYKNRMRNILPKYLRGKVKPAIAAKKSMKSSKKHGKSQKHVNSTTTTMKSKTLNTTIHTK